MNKVNITEKYTLCILKEKKNLYRREVTPYLIVSMIVEMMLDENLEITDKDKVILNDKMPTANYNKKLYEIIKDMKKDKISLRIVLNSICFGFSTKNLKSIENKKGFIGNKEVVKIDEDKFTNIIEEIKTEFLKKENLTEDSILLATLLNYTRLLKNIFKFENF